MEGKRGLGVSRRKSQAFGTGINHHGKKGKKTMHLSEEICYEFSLGDKEVVKTNLNKSGTRENPYEGLGEEITSLLTFFHLSRKEWRKSRAVTE